MKVLEMSNCMEATEKAFTELAAGTAVQPLRISMTTTDGLVVYATCATIPV